MPPRPMLPYQPAGMPDIMNLNTSSMPTSASSSGAGRSRFVVTKGGPVTLPGDMSDADAAQWVQAYDAYIGTLTQAWQESSGLQRKQIEAQIEDAKGLNNIDAIARAPRVQALVLGPADLMASLNMRTLVVGEQPEGYDVGDAYHHILMAILIAARAAGKAAIDGPYFKVRDVEAFRRVAGRSAALGYDGKWVLHPDQIAWIANHAEDQVLCFDMTFLPIVKGI